MISDVQIRFSIADDVFYLIRWLKDPKILRGFPLDADREIEEASKFWISFHRCHSSLTALCNGEVAGIATLVLNFYRKVAHHALISIIVNERFRNRGIGTLLMEQLCVLAKEHLGLEVLYLEVYEENRAIHLYERLGFKEVGRQDKFYKDSHGYLAKITMEKDLMKDPVSAPLMVSWANRLQE